ncbi:MAG: hypothetical protein ACJA2Z_000022 [Candidatus Paceibacteria bacterium]|jgi:hypothetical protein
MNNHDFNIINQLVQEQKSLWRIENHYIDEARDEEEKAFWEHMRDEKRNHIAALKKMADKCLA